MNKIEIKDSLTQLHFEMYQHLKRLDNTTLHNSNILDLFKNFEKRYNELKQQYAVALLCNK